MHIPNVSTYLADNVGDLIFRGTMSLACLSCQGLSIISETLAVDFVVLVRVIEVIVMQAGWVCACIRNWR